MKYGLLIIGFLFSLIGHASLNELGTLRAPFALAPLPYSYDALNPTIDTETMKLHHGKHHQGYVDKLNSELKDDSKNLFEIFQNISNFSKAVRDNAGGHWNHSFYWKVMTPKKDQQKLPRELKRLIESDFKSFKKFQEEFETAGKSQFGSGWVWLILNEKGKLQITSTANQDNPLMSDIEVKGYPILGIDIWEHAYYLNYQNKRDQYLKSVWNVINWQEVLENYKEAKKM